MRGDVNGGSKQLYQGALEKNISFASVPKDVASDRERGVCSRPRARLALSLASDAPRAQELSRLQGSAHKLAEAASASSIRGFLERVYSLEEPGEFEGKMGSPARWWLWITGYVPALHVLAFVPRF